MRLNLPLVLVVECWNCCFIAVKISRCSNFPRCNYKNTSHTASLWWLQAGNSVHVSTHTYIYYFYIPGRFQTSAWSSHYCTVTVLPSFKYEIQRMCETSCNTHSARLREGSRVFRAGGWGAFRGVTSAGKHQPCNSYCTLSLREWMFMIYSDLSHRSSSCSRL